jgi:Ca-activated chloride channel family protein
MSFLNPEYFWLLLFLVVAFMKKDLFNLRFTTYGYLLTFILVVIALSRPVIEKEPIQTDELLNDVVVAIDLSYSMQVNDIQPTRLAFAKESLKSLIKSEQKSRFGVLGFTTNAIVLSPLTNDSELLLHLFNALDEKLIITKGSSIMPALKLARKMSSSKKLSVVILSDGADESNYVDEVRYAKDKNIVVNILMIATKMGSTLSLKNGELLKDESGNIVVSRENSAIKTLADETGGVYTKSISEIITALSSQRDEQYKSSVTIVQNMELFYYFVALAIVVFLISVTTLKRYVLAFLLIFGINLQADLLEFVKNKNAVAFKHGVELYKEGEYEKALEAFESVKSNDAKVKSVVFYNKANALVRLKEFKKAREAYRKSLILDYSKEADDNLKYIKDVDEQMDMSTGQKKSSKKSSVAKTRKNSKKSKGAGSSNMKVDTSTSGSSDNDAKKSRSSTNINLNSTKTKLSSKQYELINKRGVDEKRPW